MRTETQHRTPHDTARARNRLSWTALGLVILLLCTEVSSPLLAQSQEGELEPLRSRIKTLERQQAEELKTLQDRLSSLEEQQSSILDEIGQRVTVGGYAAMALDTIDPAQSSVIKVDRPGASDEVRAASFGGKLELIVSGHIHDRIRFYNEIDMGVPTGEVELEQSYVDFLVHRSINLRSGVLQIPFGKFNIDHFDPRRDLTDRPVMANRVVPTTWSDIGVSLFGMVPISGTLKSSYEVALINGLDSDFLAANVTTPDSGLRDARPFLDADNNGDKAVVGRVALKVYDQFEIGGSGYRGAYDDAGNNAITGFDVDLEFKPQGRPFLEDWEFKAEYAYFDIEDSTAPSSLWGYYLQFNYHFWPSSLGSTFLGRPFNRPTFTLVGRYGHSRIKTTAGSGNLTQDRFTIGLNYRPVEDYVLKTEYQINNGGIARKDLNGFVASVSWLF